MPSLYLLTASRLVCATVVNNNKTNVQPFGRFIFFYNTMHSNFYSKRKLNLCCERYNVVSTTPGGILIVLKECSCIVDFYYDF